jgi:hypothetical protein
MSPGRATLHLADKAAVFGADAWVPTMIARYRSKPRNANWGGHNSD